MYCQGNCKREVTSVCQICEEFFCLDHGRNHQKNLKHAVQLSDDDIYAKISKNKMKKTIKLKKSKQISKITKFTNSAISSLQQIAQMQINSIKKVKSLDDFAVINFEFENHLLHLAQTGMIKEGVYSISKENISKISVNWNQNVEEIEKLRGFMKNLELANGKFRAEPSQPYIIQSPQLVANNPLQGIN